MGLFGNIKRNWKDGSLMSGLQQAGAIAQGDHATAAQIGALYRRQREESAQQQAEKAQREALVRAAIANGVPPEQAASLPSQALAQIVSKRYEPQQDPAIARNAAWWANATPEQRQAAEEYSAATAGPISTTLPNGGFYTGRLADLPKVLGQGGGGRTVTRRGTDASGKRVIQYSDGTIEYEGGGANGGTDTFRDAFAEFRF